MADILYTYKNGVYLNITNKCPCRCTFCIRSMGNGLGSAHSLWHKTEPTLEEIISAIDSFDFSNYNEAIFCGYGEPLCAFDNLIAVAQHIKKHHPEVKIRVNTNGLGNLINEKSVAKLLCENVDSVSISLNAPTAEKYLEVTRPSFGLKSFDAMLNFAIECKKYLKDIKLSVVDTLPTNEIEQCKQLCKDIDIDLRVRHYGE